MGCSLPGSFVHGNFPGKNTGVGCRDLLQKIFPTQGSNPGLPHCRWILYHLSHRGDKAIKVDYTDIHAVVEHHPLFSLSWHIPTIFCAPCFFLGSFILLLWSHPLDGAGLGSLGGNLPCWDLNEVAAVFFVLFLTKSWQNKHFPTRLALIFLCFLYREIVTV